VANEVGKGAICFKPGRAARREWPRHCAARGSARPEGDTPKAAVWKVAVLCCILAITKKWALVVALFSVWPTFSAHAQNSDTPHLEFVKLYIEQLGAIEGIRHAASKELVTDSATQRVADCVHTMTQYQLELSTQISVMRSVHLSRPLEFLPGGIADFEKPNVDYGKISASFPKINAQVEFVDQGIFKAAPAVFATLIEMTKTNSRDGLDHIIITKSEKAGLIHKIREIFCEKLKQKNQNYIVSAASVSAFYLADKGYKCSDESWD